MSDLGQPPSPATPREVLMRRAAALVTIPLLAALAIAGCGSSSSSSSSAKPAGAADTYTSVTATGAFGKAPTVTIPKAKGTGPLYSQDGDPGRRREADLPRTASSATTSRMSGPATRTSCSARPTTSGRPSLFAGRLLPGLEKALIGKQLGSRVLAVIPPKDAFGASGNSQIGHRRQRHGVFVIDLDPSSTTRRPRLASRPGRRGRAAHDHPPRRARRAARRSRSRKTARRRPPGQDPDQGHRAVVKKGQ